MLRALSLWPPAVRHHGLTLHIGVYVLENSVMALSLRNVLQTSFLGVKEPSRA